jgi:hypothetical protein
LPIVDKNFSNLKGDEKPARAISCVGNGDWAFYTGDDGLNLNIGGGTYKTRTNDDKYLLSKPTSTFLKSPLIANPYSNPSYTFPKQSTLPIIAQNRIPNLLIPSLPVVISRLHLMSISRFLFQTRKFGKPVICG